MRAYTFLGEFEYMNRLRCPDGSKPHFHRMGGRGPGPNGYRVRCIYLNRETSLYIDPHHEEYVEMEAPPGFTLGGPPDRRRLFWFEPKSP